MFIYLTVGLVVGLGLGYLLRRFLATRVTENAEYKAQRVIEEAKSKYQEVLIEARDKSIKLIDDSKKEEKERRVEISNLQKRINKNPYLIKNF